MEIYVYRPSADAAADARAVAAVYARMGKGIAGLSQFILRAIARMSDVLAIAVLPPETWGGGWLLVSGSGEWGSTGR